MSKETNLLIQAMIEFKMTLPELSRHIDLPKSTLQKWLNDGKPSKCGEIMLTLLLENKRLKEKEEAVRRVFDLFDKQ